MGIGVVAAIAKGSCCVIRPVAAVPTNGDLGLHGASLNRVTSVAMATMRVIVVDSRDFSALQTVHTL